MEKRIKKIRRVRKAGKSKTDVDYSDPNNIDYGKEVNKVKGMINFKSLYKHNSGNVRFNSFFEAWKMKKQYICAKDSEYTKLNYQIDSYSATISNLSNFDGKNLVNKCSFNLNRQEELLRCVNKCDRANLFRYMADQIELGNNILLYGYGSKLELMFEFIKYFQANVNTTDLDANEFIGGNNSNNDEIMRGTDNEKLVEEKSILNPKYIDSQLRLNHYVSNKKTYYHIIIINAFNSDIKFGLILEVIQNYFISFTCENTTDVKKFFTAKNEEDIIVKIRDYKNTYSKAKNFKILMFINNVDGPSLLSKRTQKHLSLLITGLDITLVATCDNLYFNYYWNQEIKDNYSFRYIKYNTFELYTNEIGEKFSMTGESTSKSKEAFQRIYKSLTSKQMQVIKIIAEIQLDSDKSKILDLSLKELTNKLIDYQIITTSQQLRHILAEPQSHDVIIEKLNNKNKKYYYKLNITNDVLSDLLNGEFDNK